MEGPWWNVPNGLSPELSTETVGKHECHDFSKFDIRNVIGRNNAGMLLHVKRLEAQEVTMSLV